MSTGAVLSSDISVDFATKIVVLLQSLHHKVDSISKCECHTLKKEMTEVKEMLAKLHEPNNGPVALDDEPPSRSPSVAHSPLSRALADEALLYYSSPTPDNRAVVLQKLDQAMNQTTGIATGSAEIIDNSIVKGVLLNLETTGDGQCSRAMHQIMRKDVVDYSKDSKRGRRGMQRQQLQLTSSEIAAASVTRDFYKEAQFNFVPESDTARLSYPLLKAKYKRGTSKTIYVRHAGPLILNTPNLFSLLSAAFPPGASATIQATSYDEVHVECVSVDECDLLHDILDGLQIIGTRLEVVNA